MNHLTESALLDDQVFMSKALEMARQAGANGEVPIGAVLVKKGEIVARGMNQPIRCFDPTAHAEIVALREAAKAMGNYRLSDTTLYVTIEPCSMCVGAMIHARVQRLVYGAPEPRSGAIISGVRLLDAPAHNHKIEVTSGVMMEICAGLMRQFFKDRR